MGIRIPAEKLSIIRERIYAELDKANYLNSTRTDNAVLIENLCANPEIGRIVGQYYPKEKIRTYIKDGVINRYAKEHKAINRPPENDQIDFCSRKFLVRNFVKHDSGDKEVLLLKSLEAPIYVVIVEGTALKWESALRKGLMYVASHPLGNKDQNVVHIVLSLFWGSVRLTPSDVKVLEKALSRAGADVYLWGASANS